MAGLNTTRVGAVALAGMMGVSVAAVAQPQFGARIVAPDSFNQANAGKKIDQSDEWAVVPVLDANDEIGEVYVARWDGQTWSYDSTVEGPETTPFDGFGTSAAVEGDVIAVGSPYDSQFGADSGAVHVYERQSRDWVHILKLTPNSPSADGRFGSSVAMSGDLLVVGSPFETATTGKIFVFERTGPTSWQQVSELILPAPDQAIEENFGQWVDVDGQTVVGGTFAGRVAFVFEPQGGSWQPGQFPVARLTPPPPVADDSFGFPVAISGTTVVVGARADDAQAVNAGTVHVFEMPGGGWSDTGPVARLDHDDAGSIDLFGDALDVSGDRVVVGAARNDSGLNNAGAAYVFEKPDGGWVNMNQTWRVARPEGDIEFHQFASGVSIRGDHLLIGSPSEDDSPLFNNGAVYAFSLEEPPCPADFNEDGFVTTQDFIAFLNAFTAGCP